MNVNLLASGNMLMAGAGPTSAKASTTGVSEPFILPQEDKVTPDVSYETTATDKKLVGALDKPSDEQTQVPADNSPRDFCHNIRKKISSEIPKRSSCDRRQKTEQRREKGEGKVSGIACQASSEQTTLAEHCLTIATTTGQGQTVAAVEVPVESQDGGNLPAGTGKLASIIGPNVNQGESNSLQTPGNGQPVVEAASSDVLGGLLAGEDNINITPAVDKAIVAPNGVAGADENLITKVIGGGDEAVITGENKELADTAILSSGKKADVLSSETLMSKTVAADSKTAGVVQETVAGNKQYVSESMKDSAPLLPDDVSATLQNESSEQQSLPASVGQENSIIAEKPVDSKTTVNRQTKIFSELSMNAEKQTGDISDGSTVQKLSITNINVSTDQTRNGNTDTDGTAADRLNSDAAAIGQILSNNVQEPLTGRSSGVSEQTTKSAGNTSTDSASAGVDAQVQESIRSCLRQGDQQITIHLNPPELGKVCITLQQKGDQIIGLLEVSKAQTKAEIQQTLPQVVRSLQDSGIQMKRLEVSLSDMSQSEQQSYNGRSLQSDAFGQHNSANSQSQWNNQDTSGADGRLTGAFTNGYAAFSERQQTFVGDNSINMLM